MRRLLPAALLVFLVGSAACEARKTITADSTPKDTASTASLEQTANKAPGPWLQHASGSPSDVLGERPLRLEYINATGRALELDVSQGQLSPLVLIGPDVDGEPPLMHDTTTFCGIYCDGSLSYKTCGETPRRVWRLKPGERKEVRWSGKVRRVHRGFSAYWCSDVIEPPAGEYLLSAIDRGDAHVAQARLKLPRGEEDRVIELRFEGKKPKLRCGSEAAKRISKQTNQPFWGSDLSDGLREGCDEVHTPCYESKDFRALLEREGGELKDGSVCRRFLVTYGDEAEVVYFPKIVEGATPRVISSFANVGGSAARKSSRPRK